MTVNPPDRLAGPSDAFERAVQPGARIAIENITPCIDAGKFPAKRIVGDEVTIEGDIFAEAHDQLAARICFRNLSDRSWLLAPMSFFDNDRWRAKFVVDRQGVWLFRIEAWLDVYGAFVDGSVKKRDAGLSLAIELLEGRALVAAAHARAREPVKSALAAILGNWDSLSEENRLALLIAEETRSAMRAACERPFLARSPERAVQVERERAGFAAWYELFPRSCGREPGRHGTLRDVIEELPRIRAMGFDVLYMPPIHPIGSTNRKGRNNALAAEPGDPGSTYAIGSRDGGHESVHPELGQLEDFRALVAAAAAHDMEVALDFAVQMSPNHPWLSERPEWFPTRPDGSMKFAENPPKKYEDIVNPDFYADKAVWIALRDILVFWIEQGVKTFRVDNPHTKPLPFWQWLIADIRNAHPDVVFLAEAFTRPKLMYRLAKLGFNQSYTYFTWRNSKRELTAYMTELSTSPIVDFFRPNFFVNTPDINPYFLQTGGRAAFLIRAALAATLSGLWGLYSGFELCEAEALPGREEYRDSEKYELKHRDFSQPGNISAEITQLNALRRQEPHFRSHRDISFYNAFNDNILYFGKAAPGRDDRILVAINLDPHHDQGCDFEIPLWEWGLPDHETLAVEDLLHGYNFTWTGKIQRMHLATSSPYAVWRIRPHNPV